MALLRGIEAARSAAGAVARLTTTGAALAVAPAVLTAGLLTDPARTAVRLARTGVDVGAAVAGGSLQLARTVAQAGTRGVGTLVTGANPIPDGHVRSIARVARGMFEPPGARHTRRMSADATYVQVTRTPGKPRETKFLIEELDDLREIGVRCTDTGTYTRFVLTPAREDTFAEVEIGFEPTGLMTRAFDAAVGKRYCKRWTEDALDGLCAAVNRSPA